MPERRATASAVVAAVAGQHRGAHALACSARIAAAARLDRVGDGEQARRACRRWRRHHGLSLAPQRAARALDAATSTPSSSQQRPLPSADARGRHVADTPLPATRIGAGGQRCLGAALAADDRGRPADARCRARGSPRARSSSVSSDRRRRSTADEPACPRSACPSCRRPGIDLLEPLERLGVLDQHAGCRRRARSPTMIAIGVARPSAHGHAMMSTATAFSSARASRGSGPTTPRRRTSPSRSR